MTDKTATGACAGRRLHAEWSALALPAPGAAVGGDWYDVVGRPDGTVAVVLGDVMGHGEPAAAKAGPLSTAIRTLAAEGHDHETVMGAARRVTNRLDTTATVFYGVMDLATGVLGFCSAGHPAPAVVRPRRTGWLPVVPTPPLGAGWSEGEDWCRVTIAPEEVVIVYSDGLGDASGTLPEPATRAVAKAQALGANPYQLCTATLSAVEPGADDRSVLALRVSDGPDPGRRGHTWSGALC